MLKYRTLKCNNCSVNLLLSFITYETKRTVKLCSLWFRLKGTKNVQRQPPPPLWVIASVKIAPSVQTVCQESSELCCANWLLFSSPAVVLSTLSKSTHRLSSFRPRAAECLQRFALHQGSDSLFFSAGCVTHRQPEYKSNTSVLRESDCRINEHESSLLAPKYSTYSH